MAITNGYCTLAELQTNLDPTAKITWTADQDANQEIAIEAASRWIDYQTNMRFYSASETRVYTAPFGDWLPLEDGITSVTTLKTDDDNDGTYETTWATTDYVLEPVNAAVKGEPYRRIRIDRQTGTNTFPRVRDGVQLVATFGYSTTVPPAIKQATLLLSNRLWRRKDAIFGVAGSAAIGGVQTVIARIKTDADVMELLNGVNRQRLFFA